MNDLFSDEPTGSSAIISDCGRYRYSLTREWSATGPSAVFIGLNPSTADATNDDPTIRRCIGFAKAWGCGRLVMMNLFAFRATDPVDMKKAEDPVGPQNNSHLQSTCLDNAIVVAAWGADGGFRGRDREVLALLVHVRVQIKCLGLTAEGFPRHPLYMPASSIPFPYSKS